MSPRMTTTPTSTPAHELELLVLDFPNRPVIHLGQAGPEQPLVGIAYREVSQLCSPEWELPYVVSAVRPASPERIREAVKDPRMCRACASAYQHAHEAAPDDDGVLPQEEQP